MKNFSLREFIYRKKCVVVLDTSTARGLAYQKNAPQWVSIFSEMKKDGYLFSLGDAAFMELFVKNQSGAMNSEEVSVMRSHLSKFLCDEMPLLLGKVEIERMIGLSETSPNWDHDVIHLSRAGWDAIGNHETFKNPVAGENLLNEERSEWKRIFLAIEKATEKMINNQIDHFYELFSAEYTYDQFKTKIEKPLSEIFYSTLNEYEHEALNHALEAMNSGNNIIPSLSIRRDLEVRYIWRQFVRSKKLEKPYNLNARKNVNDGIDFDFYRYLMLPALVVTEDTGFLSRIQDIPSYQTDWFFKAADLAEHWLQGKPHLPKWPE